MRMSKSRQNTSPWPTPLFLPSNRLFIRSNQGTNLLHNSGWRGGRVVESARLESVFTLTGNEGSNPSLSAMIHHPPSKSLRISARRR